MPYQLIGSDISYFTGKARAYLRWKGVSFEEVPASRDVYANIILPRVGWAVIPVVITPDDTTLQDTSDIIDFIEAAEGGPSVYPDGARQKLVALMMELYGDEWLVLPAMHYRWNYNEDWVYGEFGRNSRPDLSSDEQYVAGKEVGAKFRGFLPPLGVTDGTIPGIEASYEGFLADFSAHLERHDFLLGSRPSIGDYGLIGPLYAHLYRDPASGDIMKRLAPKVAEWVERCHAPSAPLSGTFLSGDEVPGTLRPILARQVAEQFPSLKQTIDAFAGWCEAENPEKGRVVPRGLGAHAFTIGGRDGERVSMTFSLWMLQRVLDHYSGLNQKDKSACDKLLRSIGLTDIEAFRLPRRLERRNFKLCVA